MAGELEQGQFAAKGRHRFTSANLVNILSFELDERQGGFFRRTMDAKRNQEKMRTRYNAPAEARNSPD